MCIYGEKKGPNCDQEEFRQNLSKATAADRDVTYARSEARAPHRSQA